MMTAEEFVKKFGTISDDDEIEVKGTLGALKELFQFHTEQMQKRKSKKKSKS